MTLSPAPDDWASDVVRQFLAERTGREASNIQDSELLITFDIDSLDWTEWIIALEETYGDRPLPELPMRSTVGDLVDAVRESLT